jgi:eukaryotic-like serine/threonine-protein kinase
VTPAAPETIGPFRILGQEVSSGPVRCYRVLRNAGEGMTRRSRLRCLDLRQLEDPKAEIRFLDEAQLITRLTHPGIIFLEDYGLLDDQLYLEEEIVNGADLGTILKRVGPLPQGAALLVTCRIAEILSYVHTARDGAGNPMELVHRNLTPRNVHITEHGETKLSGFGMARYRGKLLTTALRTAADEARYASPEDVRGQTSDQRSDLHGLGILLYEMLTTHCPFAAPSLAEIPDKILAGDYPSPRESHPELDPRVTDLVDHLLRPAPEDRPQHAAWVWERCWKLWREVGSPHEENRLRQLVADVVARGDDKTLKVPVIAGVE